jgi:hypothetical protein
MDLSHSLQDTKYGSSPTSSSSSSVGGGPFNTSISSRGGAITDPSFPYFPPPFNPAFAAQFDVHAAASAIEHYPTFNYGTPNGSSASSSPYGNATTIHHQHASPSSNTFTTSSYDPYASAYAATAAAARHHHSILDAHHHHHAADLYSRHSQHHQTSATSLVDHTARVSWKFFFPLFMIRALMSFIQPNTIVGRQLRHVH